MALFGRSRLPQRSTLSRFLAALDQPTVEALPPPHRRFEQICAPGYQGRKRGEVVRTRTVLLQAHTHQFLGTFGGPGNGDYRDELLRAIAVITDYATKLGLSPASVLLRLDGLYGDAAPLLDVLAAGLGVIVRSRDYSLLYLEVVKLALAHTPITAAPTRKVAWHERSTIVRPCLSSRVLLLREASQAQLFPRFLMLRSCGRTGRAVVFDGIG